MAIVETEDGSLRLNDLDLKPKCGKWYAINEHYEFEECEYRTFINFLKGFGMTIRNLQDNTETPEAQRREVRIMWRRFVNQIDQSCADFLAIQTYDPNNWVYVDEQ